MRPVAIALGVVAAGLVVLAVRDMVVGERGALRGWLVRTAAVLCFAAAVILNALAR